MNTQDIDIIAAVAALKDKYPFEKRVAVWVEYQAVPDYRSKTPGYWFSAVIGEAGENAVYGNGATLSDALCAVIMLAGDRDPRKELAAKIEKMRAELAKLEAEAQTEPAKPERDEPIIYERGELAPTDNRGEHDKSL